MGQSEERLWLCRLNYSLCDEDALEIWMFQTGHDRQHNVATKHMVWTGHNQSHTTCATTTKVIQVADTQSRYSLHHSSDSTIKAEYKGTPCRSVHLCLAVNCIRANEAESVSCMGTQMQIFDVCATGMTHLATNETRTWLKHSETVA